jgi:excinuclease ABC subunit B
LIVKEEAENEELALELSDIEKSTLAKAKKIRSAPKASTSAQKELVELIDTLTGQMRGAAMELRFELAARLRDEIRELKKELRALQEAGI